MRVDDGIHLGCSLILPVDTVNRVQTLKAGTDAEVTVWFGGIVVDAETCTKRVVKAMNEDGTKAGAPHVLSKPEYANGRPKQKRCCARVYVKVKLLCAKG
jgi:hypothetical protein